MRPRSQHLLTTGFQIPRFQIPDGYSTPDGIWNPESRFGPGTQFVFSHRVIAAQQSEFRRGHGKPLVIGDGSFVQLRAGQIV